MNPGENVFIDPILTQSPREQNAASCTAAPFKAAQKAQDGREGGQSAGWPVEGGAGAGLGDSGAVTLPCGHVRSSPEARRGSQGASRAAPGKSGLHARGEGERVLALE